MFFFFFSPIMFLTAFFFACFFPHPFAGVLNSGILESGTQIQQTVSQFPFTHLSILVKCTGLKVCISNKILLLDQWHNDGEMKLTGLSTQSLILILLEMFFHCTCWQGLFASLIAFVSPMLFIIVMF